MDRRHEHCSVLRQRVQLVCSTERVQSVPFLASSEDAVLRVHPSRSPADSGKFPLMIGFVYLLLALGCWTVWAVLSARMGGRFTPLNSLLWTGLVSAVITVGGFLLHYRHLRLPSGNDWWLLGIFCAANTLACFGYYAALKYLPGSLVLPLSHLYLVFGPVLLALMEKRAFTWQQFVALSIMMGGVAMFLAVSPATCRSSALPKAASKTASLGTDFFSSRTRTRVVAPALTYQPRSAADCWRSGPLRASRAASRSLADRRTVLSELQGEGSVFQRV